MLIIFNPVAGRRRAHLLWRVLDHLVANGIRLEIAETTRRGDAEALARAAAARGAPLVVAAGGDGTIAEVANGLIGSASALGLIPLGTANVLAHEIGLPLAPIGIAAALAFHHYTWLLAISFIWGVSVVADSAQFSAIITEVADQRYVGTALTLQTAAGFLLTTVSIKFAATFAAAHGWSAAMMMLALGPIFGTTAMLPLLRQHNSA